MKKLASVLLAVIALVILLVGCDVPAEVSREPKDTRYTAAYDGVETEYNYQYDWVNGKFKYLPEMKSVHYPEEFEVLYLCTYDDGSTSERWETVDKSTYDSAIDLLGGDK